MDIFMLVDENNDKFLTQEEVTDFLKAVTTKKSTVADENDNEALIQAWKNLYNKHQKSGLLNFINFARFMKALEIGESTAELRYKISDIKFGGCASKIFLCPIRCILRWIRAYAVSAQLKLELEKKSAKDKKDDFDLNKFATERNLGEKMIQLNQLEKYIQNFGGTLDDCLKEKNEFDEEVVKALWEECKTKQSEIKAAGTGFIGMILGIYKEVTEFTDRATDWILLYQTYWLSQSEENSLNLHYKIINITLLMCVSAKYLISYSSIVNYQLQQGNYEPEKLENAGCFLKFCRVIFLTIIGPFMFAVMEIINVMKVVLQITFALLINQGKVYDFINSKANALYYNYIGISPQMADGREAQSSIAQLSFQTVPMLILQFSVIFGVLKTPEIVEGESRQALFFSMGTTILTIINTTFKIYIEATALQEPFLMYALTCMKARQGWVPFISKIQSMNVKFSINYGEIQCPYPSLTPKCGIYNKFAYQFDDISLTQLTSELTIWKNKQKLLKSSIAEDSVKVKYALDLGQSLTYVTINTALHFLHLAPKDLLDIKMNVHDWSILIETAKKSGLIPKDPSKYDAKTPSGHPLLWVCVDDEPSGEQGDQNWMLESCLEALLKDGCDPNTQNNLGETLLIHAIRQNKFQSIKKLLNYGGDPRLKNKQGLNPFGQAILSGNHQVIEFLLENHSDNLDVHNESIQDQKLGLEKYSPLTYVCKMAEKTMKDEHGQPKFIALNELFMRYNLNPETEEEKVNLMHQVVFLVQYLEIHRESGNGQNDKGTNIMLKIIADHFETKGIDILQITDPEGNKFLHKYFLEQHMGYETMLEVLENFECSKNYREEVKVQLFQKNSNNITPWQLVCKIRMQQKKEASKAIDQVLCILDLQITKFPNQEQETSAIEYLKWAATRNIPRQTWTEARDKIVSRMDHHTPEQVDQILKKQAFDDLDQYLEGAKPSLSDPESEELVPFKRFYINLGIEEQFLSDFLSKNKQSGQSDQVQSQSETNQVFENLDTALEVSLVRNAHSQDDNQRILDIRSAKQKVKILSGDKKMVDDQKQKSPNTWIGALFTFTIELLSAFDLVSDIYLLRAMIKSEHTAWTCITIFQMVSPLFVSYVPLITFQLERNSFKLLTSDKQSISKAVLGFVTATPLILFYLQFMDLLYLINSVLFEPIILFVKKLSCDKIDLSNISQAIDDSYVILFDMTDMDIGGFRRLRTISQLSFESFPQVVLQTWILRYQMYYPEKVEDLDVSIHVLLLSLSFALAHTIFEMMFVKLEAIACKTSFMHYSIICFNGRFGWVPFTNKFTNTTGRVATGDERQECLDYDDITSQFCRTRFGVTFKFSTGTLQGLAKSLTNLPIEKLTENRFNLKLGKSANSVSIDDIIQLLQMAYQRVNIDIEDVDIDEMIKCSPDFLNSIRDPPDDKDQVPILIEMIQIGNWQMVQKLCNNQASLEIKDLEGKGAIQIAIDSNDAKMIETLMKMNDPFLDKQFLEISNNISLYTKWAMQMDKEVIRSLVSTPENTVSCKSQETVIKNAIEMINSGDLKGYDMINLICGPYFPAYLTHQLKQNDKFETTSLHKYHEKFPQTVNLTHTHDNQQQTLGITTEKAFSFQELRKLLIHDWKINHDGPNFEDQKQPPLDLSQFPDLDLENVELITLLIDPDTQKQVPNLSIDEVKKLDETVDMLGLDQYRWRYFSNTRFNRLQNQVSNQIFTKEYKSESKVKVNANDENSLLPGDKNLACNNGFKGKQIIKIQVPDEVLAIQRIDLDFKLEDQGWGGTGHSFLEIQIWKKREAYADVVQAANRDDESQTHPNYKIELNNNKVKTSTVKPYQIDLLSNVTGGDTLVFKAFTPCWGGWSVSCQRWQANFHYIKRIAPISPSLSQKE